ncbi:AAA family ATPase [bacterium]|nr:AAA family ATPase [bacterium]
MYLDYWKLKQKPFENTPDPDFFYFSPEHEEAYIRFKYAISENKGAILLTGDYGCGKTTLIRLLVSELDPERFRIAILNHPRGDINDLLKAILIEFEEPLESPIFKTDSTDAIERRIGERLIESFEEKTITLLIIDEAQLLKSDHIFEEIRLLLNFQLNDRFLINIFLVGQPELRDHVNKLPQFEQRLYCKYHLHVLDLNETTNYINHRLTVAGLDRSVFTSEAIRLIYQNSKGTPRRINNICDLSLLFGSSQKVEMIDTDIIQSVL